MKKYIIALILATILLLPATAQADQTPAVAQHSINAFAYTGNQATISELNNITAGNLLVVSVTIYSDTRGTPEIASVTDNVGDTFHLAFNSSGSTDAPEALYYAYNAVGGQTTVTVTPGNSGADYIGYMIGLVEFSGVANSSDPFEVAAGRHVTGTSADSPTITTSNAHDLLFGLDDYDPAASATLSVGSHDSLIQSKDGVAGAPEMFLLLRNTSTTGNYHMGGTWSISVAHRSIIAAFKAHP